MLDDQPLGEYPELDWRSVPANQPLRTYTTKEYEQMKLRRDQFMFGYGFHRF